MHTIDAAETVSRLVEFFPEAKQMQIRSIIAGVLRVVSQRLLPKVDGGQIAAVEVMVNNVRIADLIRELRTDEIQEAIAEGSFFDTDLHAGADRRPRRDDRRRGRRPTPPRIATTSWSRSSARRSWVAAAREAEEDARAPTRRARDPGAPRRRAALRGMRRATLVAALAVLAVRGWIGPRGRVRGRARVATLPLALPSAEAPNTPGSLLLPAAWTERAIAPSAISYPELEALWRRAGARTASIGTCSPRSTRSSRTSAGTWARARQARSAGCSSCPTPGCGGAPTGTATASPTRKDPEDGVYSAARYLAAAGGTADLRRSIFAYNHANWYVDDVLELAALFGQGAGETTLVYDDLKEDAPAERAVVQATKR